MNDTENQNDKELLFKARLDLEYASRSVVHATDCMEKAGVNAGVVREYMKTAYDAIERMRHFLDITHKN